MKFRIVMSIGCLMIAGLSGCCNYATRTEGKVAPYACAPHPYYCTAEVWQDVAFAREYYCGLVAMFALATWPITVVDEVCEVAFDTVFLPVDLTYLFVKDDGEGESTPAAAL
ncbi:MAG: hypothetical protein II840_07570 [Kiritimatiellae bacterium]|nr:hypothetical protein [Kiritimatiellia bacterium]